MPDLAPPIITVFALGPYQTNCHVITSGEPRAGAECWVVDCGMEPEEMIDWIANERLQLQAVYLTHTHLDHIAGVDRLLARLAKHGLPVFVHEKEAGFCSDPMLNLSALIGLPTTCREPDRHMRDGDVVVLGASSWRVLHTPGHSPGGVCLVHDGSKQAIVGDTLFAGSIGRHDFPASDVRDLRRSIQRLMQLPDDMTIYPGHGPSTTIGEERVTNPYVVNGF